MMNKVKEDIKNFIKILPEKIKKQIKNENLEDALEIVLDLGRVPEIRNLNGEINYINTDKITQEDIDYVVRNIPPFTHDNRSGISGTLHRISAIRNRQDKVIGLTLRIGRSITGTIDCINDIIQKNKSILFLGRPGVGKTTKLREISRLLANDLKKRVVIVDTSNEIGGDGDIPHDGIGKARRMQVSQPEYQKDIMIEAVQNHTPEVIVVDEIGTESEALAARTIAERGVMLIATAHGNTLENLIKNPTLSDLIGGIQSVTLGDEEAKKRATQKTILEREKKPTFDIVIELIDKNTLSIYKNTAEAVDYFLRNWPIRPEIRKIHENYNEKSNDNITINNEIKMDNNKIIEDINPLNKSFSPADYIKKIKEFKKVFLYSVSRTITQKVIDRLNLNIEITKNIDEADLVIINKSFIKEANRVLSLANDLNLPIFYIRSNSMSQVQKVLKDSLALNSINTNNNLSSSNNNENTIIGYNDDIEKALDEVKTAALKIFQGSDNIILSAQKKYIRRLQHDLIEQYNLKSESIPDEGDLKRLKIFK